MNNFKYNSNLKIFARLNRNDSTKAEIRIWCELLRAKKMMVFSFLRQRPVGSYIADFFYKDLNLVIEIDGYSHHLEEIILKDRIKTQFLENMGLSILRFSDEEVMKNIDNVNRTIESWIINHPPTPFKGGLELNNTN